MHWLVKSEPEKYPWSKMVTDRRTFWDGVRNHQAANNLKAMQVGDEAFFYHSNDERAVVGIVRVARLYYADPSDESGKFGMVDVEAVAPLVQPVTLAQIKAEPELAGIALVRQSRLSVQPIDDAAWDRILALGGGRGRL